MGEKVVIVGAGDMAIEYAKVLSAMDMDYIIVGRGEEKAERCEKLSNHAVVRGGIERYLSERKEIPSMAIVTVYPLVLKDVTIKLLEAGVKNILVEKPAGIDLHEIKELSDYTAEKNANVYVAYNRRFYASVETARKMIADDGGVTSFNFEFTEWSHQIEKLDKPKGELEGWFMANSTHVVDLAFFLGGVPIEMNSYVKGALPWYSKAAAFAGAGISDKGAPFSYKANWMSAGRWSVEILTNKNKYIFEPMEKLQIQKRGEIQVSQVEIDDELDIKFKPGLYRQVEAFVTGDNEKLIDIHQHCLHAKIYEQMEKNGHYSS
ncbi:Predicted dehydrogenase [Lachnospiraceae bacterium C10]|nr:Predicted dehydrogenase [Lachnospiraceae bacterium C10]